MTAREAQHSAPQALEALNEGRLADARALASRATREGPSDADAWGVLAEVLARDPARSADARAAYATALRLRPEWVPLRQNYANLLLAMGNHQEAAIQSRVVLRAQADHPFARLNLAAALSFVGDTDQATDELRELTRLRPDFAPGWAELSRLLLERRQVDAALQAAHAAVAADEACGLSHFRLAEALCETGRASQAAHHFDRAAALLPGESAIRGKRLLMLSHLPDISAETLVAEHRAEGRRIASATGAPLPPPSPARHGTAMRVGYVSADMHAHAVTSFLVPVLRAHDREAVTLYGYDTHPARQQNAPAIARHFDHWRPAGALGDEELAQRIRDDGIDVLIDLSGHTRYHRLGVFARRPARLHWQWFGYPMLTGLDAFDARLTDQWTDPSDGYDAGETLVRLPSRLVWAPETPCPPVTESPALSGAPFTFASFNSLGKTNKSLLDAWTAILSAAPGSRLRLGHADSPDFTHVLRAKFAAAGVHPDRLEVLPKMPMQDYLAAHAGVDLLLDSFPYNGGTTTAHALWQGVPVLALAGTYAPHRIGAAYLLQLGMDACVASSVEDYVSRAVAFAAQPLQLQDWRRTLRDRIQGCALGQPRLVVAALEAEMARALRA